MPNIKTFDAGNLALRPSEVGVEATAGAARRIGAFGNQKAQALDTLGQRAGGAVRDVGEAGLAYEDHREISHGAATGASLVNDLSNQWNEAAKNADPNDPSVAGKFREEVLEPRLQKFSEGFNTQRSQAWAEHFVDGFRQHMFQKTTADMSSLAADAVHMNVEQTRNALVNATYNDPSSLNFSRDALTHSTDGLIGSSPNLSAASASKVKQELTFKGEQELVHAAISGAIAKGGDWQAIANDPKNAPYIKRPELEQFVKSEKAQQKANDNADRQAAVLKKQQNTAAGGDALAKNFTDNVSYDVQGNPAINPRIFTNSLDIVRKYPEVAEHARALNNWAESKRQEKKERVVDDQAVKADFLKRVDDDTNPLTQAQIFQAEAEGKITAQTGTIFRGMQKNTVESKELKPERDLFLKRYELQIDTARDQKTGLGVPSPLGQANMLRAEMDLRRQEATLRRAGQDPHSLYDPASPNFFGKPENIAKYQPTMQEGAAYERQLKETAAGKTAVPPAQSDRPTRYIHPNAVQMLRNNPSMRDDFDAHYGAGQAAKILGK